MASQNPNPNRVPMYPQVIDPTAPPIYSSNSSSSLYPTIDMTDLAQNLFPNSDEGKSPGSQPAKASAPPQCVDETLITIPGVILHLIDKQYSVELATGDLRIVRLRQGDNTLAALASVADDVQWPLTADIASVKLDSFHYFFSFKAPDDPDSGEDAKKGKKNHDKDKVENEMLSYGLTIASKGQERLLIELDTILETFSNFSVQKVEEKAAVAMAGAAAREITPGELKADTKKKAEVEGQCAAYWTTLAPNVEDYSGTAAKLIATGSGKLVKGILWCGDVTMDRLNRGDEVLRSRMAPGEVKEIDPATLRRIRRVKRVTSMTEKVALGVLSGVVKVSGFFTGSIANSSVGKKFFSLLPGEIVLASLDGFSKVCDAVEVSGKNVMSTSSTVTTGLVSHKYGEEAGKATSESLDAAGHAIGTAWAVFKLRKALNPKSVLKPTTLAKSAAKSAAAEMKAKGSK
ncbi:protein EARLY-RESPONSIVE TO DEHYDRATION 7, chloroplastic-like [Andrographis paniculata]|uniref:protein EARLY-RESPONSIVE TO DEHYDRATION 7, chloroplastic-like n=1 Tax=Andrographis paniculata TaxID=175694 RepID=UPI0021E7A426|nr:protein EARLY-RESPONSIVE TO DEHYDRATION 7, chloroplastic-like [Andrographis paniculata]